MRLQILASGSGGNAALVWAGDALLLLDAGLGHRVLAERLDAARVGFRALGHVLVSHGHLDHSRSAGIVAKKHDATLLAPAKILDHPALARARERRPVTVGVPHLIDAGGGQHLEIDAVAVPHDCDPTYAYRLRHGGRTLSVITDMGEPREDVARALGGAHVLVLESNHDPAMLSAGPYSASLKSRVAGAQGHLSNAEMATMLRRLAGPDLHTVVLAHISEKNNRHDLAVATARDALDAAGRPDVRVVAAHQDTPLDPIDV